jgi:S1-C subfamily serine protease
MDENNVDNLLAHCSPDDEQEVSTEEVHSFSPSADAENVSTQPPPAPPTPPFTENDGSNDLDLFEDDFPEETVPIQPKKKHTASAAVKVTVLVLCVAALIAASAMFFSNIGELSDSSSVSFSFGTSDDADDSADSSSDKTYETYDDFFSAYYNGTTTGVSDMQTATAEDGMELTITPHSGDTLSLTEIYAKCSPSVVGIKAGVDSTDQYWGTGIIFSENGYIVTNFHIIDGTNTATIVLNDDDESEYEAYLVGYDSDSDLAVLKIDAEGLTPAEFGDSSELEVGEDVTAIGNPLGEQFRGTMTRGIISAID